ncbi:Phospholipid scramblase 2 [Hypsibius exemplaris]|uniref:Phospholipid scramblase n=1 Tax=Hypsibius exemplaris TaxID=2072580 RepID=A0A9X6NFJ2_HYPEX|nr:Phospholipid scramblase 2 [Hypsibius exemplaris]
MSDTPITTQPGSLKAEELPPQEGGGQGGQQIPMHRRAQPGAPVVAWMPIPTTSLPNCPPGLEYLTLIDQLLVSQKVELFEVMTGFETNNKYAVLNALGQQIYYAKEDNDFCTRQCFGKMRPFDMSILDNFQREVIHINRPFACMHCCYPCCLQTMEVTASGAPIGYIEQEWSLCTPLFRILNAKRETVLKIEGPIITCSCFGNVDFQVLSADGQTQVGKISKQWSGLARELFTDADNFGIQFPIDLSVEVKATLLAANFLIDFMYFEDSHNNNNN